MSTTCGQDTGRPILPNGGRCVAAYLCVGLHIVGGRRRSSNPPRHSCQDARTPNISAVVRVLQKELRAEFFSSVRCPGPGKTAARAQFRIGSISSNAFRRLGCSLDPGFLSETTPSLLHYELATGYRVRDTTGDVTECQICGSMSRRDLRMRWPALTTRMASPFRRR